MFRGHHNRGTIVFWGTLLLISAWLLLHAVPGAPPLRRDAEAVINTVLVLLLLVSYLFREWSVRVKLKAERAADSRRRREMRRQVERSDLRYKNLLDGAGDAILVINAETGQLEEVNAMGTVLLGYSQEELRELSGRELVPVRDQAELISLVRRVNAHGMATLDRLTLMRKDGSSFLGEVNARLIDLGEVKVVQAIIRDITKAAQAAEEIGEQNRKLSLLNAIVARVNESLDLSTVLETTLKETLVAFGPGGGTVHLMVQDLNLLSLAAKHEISDRFAAGARSVDHDVTSSCPVVCLRCHVATEVENTDCTILGLAREAGWSSVVGIPLTVRNRLVGVMHIMTSTPWCNTAEDLSFIATIGNQIGIAIHHARMFTELKEKNEELVRSHTLLARSTRRLTQSQDRLVKNLELVERARQELERLDRMRNNIFGMTSHEFRTPLTGILSGVELLLSSRESLSEEEERQILETIEHGGKQLHHLVTNLLKVMRLEAKKETVTKSALHLEDVIGALLVQFCGLLENRNVQVITRDLEQLPHFYGDRTHLEEVFGELLLNAVKFSSDGGQIVISGQVTNRALLEGKREILDRFDATFYEQMGPESYLQVAVSDDGIGIVHGEQRHIFETFYELGDIRHHSSGKDSYLGKGTGLGLAIVQGMVEAHGGMVWVESRTGEPGSTFFLLFPLEETSCQQSLPFGATFQSDPLAPVVPTP